MVINVDYGEVFFNKRTTIESIKCITLLAVGIPLPLIIACILLEALVTRECTNNDLDFSAED